MFLRLTQPSSEMRDNSPFYVFRSDVRSFVFNQRLFTACLVLANLPLIYCVLERREIENVPLTWLQMTNKLRWNSTQEMHQMKMRSSVMVRMMEKHKSILKPADTLGDTYQTHELMLCVFSDKNEKHFLTFKVVKYYQSWWLTVLTTKKFERAF